MKPTQALHEAGQSMWLGNITRNLLDTGTLTTYIEQYSITGLTSNPTIFDKSIEAGADYDATEHHQQVSRRAVTRRCPGRAARPDR